jgi:NDP-sugar pyrophosphorylase family protein
VKAFVLAGGLGTRLRPKFGELPKPLAPIAGRPFLERQLAWLAAHGVRHAALCTGYGGDAIHAALGDGAAFGVGLEYSEETEPLGTGGALRLARPLVDGPCWVMNGDTLPDGDPWQVEGARWRSGALGAIALYEVADARARGRVECDATGRVTRFVEKDMDYSGPAWVNGGLYAFSSALWRFVPDGKSSLERDVLPGLAADGRLLGVRLPGTFYDIGTPEEWDRAERHFSA